jgi:hypothetical protein
VLPQDSGLTTVRSDRNRIMRGDGEGAGHELQRVPATAADVPRQRDIKGAAQRCWQSCTGSPAAAASGPTVCRQRAVGLE